MTNLGSRDYLILRTVWTWLPVIFGYSDILSFVLSGRFSDDDMALEGALSEMLMSIEPDMFMRVFAEWKHQLQQCIDQAGDYL
jgi:hypothetical protein